MPWLDGLPAGQHQQMKTIINTTTQRNAIMSSSSNKEVTLYEFAGFVNDAAEMLQLQRRMSSRNEALALAASTCLEDRKGCCDDLAFLKKCVDQLEKRSCNQAANS